MELSDPLPPKYAFKLIWTTPPPHYDRTYYMDPPAAKLHGYGLEVHVVVRNFTFLALIISFCSFERFKLSNKAKRFAKQQRSNACNTLACFYRYFLWAELNGWRIKEELHRPVINSCKNRTNLHEKGGNIPVTQKRNALSEESRGSKSISLIHTLEYHKSLSLTNNLSTF